MKDIIINYLEGRATKTEQTKLLVWLRNKENRKVFNSCKTDWKIGLNKEQIPEGSEKSWNNIQEQLLQKSYSRWHNSQKSNMFFKIAAIFFFVVSVGSLAGFFIGQSNSSGELSTGVFADKGQISKVELPDGSMVWLNSGSKLSYNNQFAANNRNIYLKGEAYFQVTKNKEIPLIVNSGHLLVKVLGTKFNVSAYPESEKIDVVLESGKVELLHSKVESFQYQLKPGERASFNKADRKLDVSKVNTSKYTSWKNGIINIYNQTLEELTKRLETRYNQEFDYAPELKDYHFTFTIKNESLDEIIHLMERVAPVKAVQKENIIVFEMDQKRERSMIKLE